MSTKKLKTYIIAEAGVNHNGSNELAMKLIDVAANAGADAVKFQTFKAKNIVSKKAKKASYQIEATGDSDSAFEMLKKLELDEDIHHSLASHAKGKGIDFLSTAFDEESLIFLTDKLNLQTLKIPSGEITNFPLILAHARTHRNIILSTGMATLDEIRAALEVIAYGYIDNGVDEFPTIKKFKDAFLSKEAQSILKEKVTILHCTTEYPAPINEINLLAIQTIKNEFEIEIGYSDHTKGIHISPIAVALGARIIEKHFTLDSSMIGPDHKASLEPDKLKEMIDLIRDVEDAMGSGIKEPSASEIPNMEIIRKSICAEQEIKKGELLTSQNISIKRPGGGMCPSNYWKFIGKKSKKLYQIGDFIEE